MNTLAILLTISRVTICLHKSSRTVNAAPGTTRAHSEETFLFMADAAIEKVAPLFGADKERVWAPGWDPVFIHPASPQDARGMVFTVSDDRGKSIWACTEFDLKGGRIQYVYVIPDAMVTVITLWLTPQGKQTRVDVKYERTSLTEAADPRVGHMAEKDRAAGPEWQEQVNGYLKRLSR